MSFRRTPAYATVPMLCRPAASTVRFALPTPSGGVGGPPTNAPEEVAPSLKKNQPVADSAVTTTGPPWNPKVPRPGVVSTFVSVPLVSSG